jgi:hypothetical protein
MKKLLLFLFGFIISASFAQGWDGVCEDLNYTHDITPKSGTTGEYTLKVHLKNVGSDDIPSYCDSETSLTNNVNISTDNSCYGALAPNDTKTLEYDVTVTDNSLTEFKMELKLKHATDSDKFCKKVITVELKEMNVEELNNNTLLSTTYFDLMGRVVKEPLPRGFYIVKRTFENGSVQVEKIYLNN